jgi:hypothetical protein
MLLLIDVAEQIAKRRKTVGLTQAELARMARVSRSTLDALENGRMGRASLREGQQHPDCPGTGVEVAERTRTRPTLDELMIENELKHRSYRRPW